MWLKTATLCFLNLTFNYALAWGPNGHRIVGQIAQAHLTSEAKKEVDKILNGESLAQVSTWADEMRPNHDYDYIVTWHYVSIPTGKTYEQSEKEPKGDILKALKEMESNLKSEKLLIEKKRESLKLLVHFMGDLHQPLHVGRGDDRGGNWCYVRWMNESHKTNLHEVWDSLLIQSNELSFTEYATFLDHITDVDIKNWSTGDYEAWANESKDLREKIYPKSTSKYCQDKAGPPYPSIKQQPLLGWDYRYEHLGELELRLKKAGIRLAQILNRIF